MLEVACFNTTSAVAAAHAGADRIELCADYAGGGITPALASLQQLRKYINIPINVMIRPREGDFRYLDAEFQQMKSYIQLYKPDASGFVFGILDDQNHVDGPRNQALVELATPLPCTFHRAFDQVPDQHEAMERLIKCGFTSILTSGGQLNAVSGAEQVTELQKKFGDKITFILGGGVRSSNAKALQQQTNVPWLHSAAITQPGEDADKDEVMKLHAILSGEK
ncbi:hypothetical protein K504DRAFT_465517 [Pleomassaria siparia CBS 279.74]|uniref:Copper homeostasis protein cutC homolog n=1 Tax=Pleomassaria siparia CBS 279.74 TaxID=1314801 RepID=A0A6G1KG75_9PLEO|nr:hypothetical protein K504DRAFT_465517 [Pleomassaria siparia CBS 279.74]